MRPKQQTLWDWTSHETRFSSFPTSSPDDASIVFGPQVPELESSRRDAYFLRAHLTGALVHPVELHIHNNRKRMLSIAFKNASWSLRLHHMFLGCEVEVVDALIRFIRGESEARPVLLTYIKAHREAIDHALKEQPRARGRCHDLSGMLKRIQPLIEAHGYTLPESLMIGWGRHGRGKRSIRLGSYDASRSLIRIHPALDQAWVPAFFVEYIVYHEALHSVIEPVYDRNRRIIHTAEFLSVERLFPQYIDALNWEKSNLRRLLQGN